MLVCILIVMGFSFEWLTRFISRLNADWASCSVSCLTVVSGIGVKADKWISEKPTMDSLSGIEIPMRKAVYKVDIAT
ncbi:hypothetical protein D3C73_1415990 [compost metagenome]